MQLSNVFSLSAPKTIYILGFLGVALALWHLAQNNIAVFRGGWGKFDPAYSLADEAFAFTGVVTLLIAERLDGLGKRLKKLEEKTTTPDHSPKM